MGFRSRWRCKGEVTIDDSLKRERPPEVRQHLERPTTQPGWRLRDSSNCTMHGRDPVMIRVFVFMEIVR